MNLHSWSYNRPTTRGPDHNPDLRGVFSVEGYLRGGVVFRGIISGYRVDDKTYERYAKFTEGLKLPGSQFSQPLGTNQSVYT